MTIKQQGGIFGRNPTFNDVDANSLDVDGSITATGLTVDGSIATTGGSTNNRGLLLSHQNNINASFISRSENGAADTGNRLLFDFDNDSFQVNTGGATRLDISNTGNVNVKTGNLVIGTSGKGIDFSATSGTGTSELFSDYEQGTFTPVVKGTTTDPSVTSGTAYGRYTKIGNRVFGNVFMRQVWSTAGSGTLYVDGFPFTMLENHFPGISLGLTDLVGTISNGYLSTVYGTSGCAAVLTGASGVTGSNRYITFMFQYVTGSN